MTPDPEATLENLYGLTFDVLAALVKRAKLYGNQIVPEKHMDRFWMNEIGGTEYVFAYWNDPKGSRYAIQHRMLVWSLGWRGSRRRAPSDKPWFMLPLVSDTPSVCYDFSLEGDVEQYRHDMTLLRTFL